MILISILNHLYLGDLILILKLSIYDDFAISGSNYNYKYYNKREHNLSIL